MSANFRSDITYAEKTCQHGAAPQTHACNSQVTCQGHTCCLCHVSWVVLLDNLKSLAVGGAQKS